MAHARTEIARLPRQQPSCGVVHGDAWIMLTQPLGRVIVGGIHHDHFERFVEVLREDRLERGGNRVAAAKARDDDAEIDGGVHERASRMKSSMCSISSSQPNRAL